MKKFKDKYRIESTRLQDWDYGKDAYYFITICTIDRECYFGGIENGEMKYFELGLLAEKLLQEISKQYDYVQLDKYVIMPNHIHAIIKIDKQIDYSNTENADYMHRRDAINRVSTKPENMCGVNLNTKQTGGFAGKKNPMLNDNLSRVIRWFKGRMTFECRKTHADFGWQSRFYDHVIRDEESYFKIRNYIEQNPLDWIDDDLHPDNKEKEN